MSQKAEPIVLGSKQRGDWKMNSNKYKQDTHLGFVVTYQHGRDGTKIKEKLFDC